MVIIYWIIKIYARQGILFILFMALASNFANSMDNRNTLVERAISTIDNHNYKKQATNILKNR